jgi:sugar O-acyltransferase (sialic acid O-acetyltransferase NeuD family)
MLTPGDSMGGKKNPVRHAPSFPHLLYHRENNRTAMAREILLLGGGGHCRSLIDVLEKEGSYRIRGILDVAEKLGQEVLGYPIIGTEEDLPELLRQSPYCLVSVGQVGPADLRMRLYQRLKEAGAVLPLIISTTAYVSPHAHLGEGTVVMHQACVNAGAEVGANSIINSQALLEHDVRVGDHCHISTAAVLNGGCRIGDAVLVGSRAALRQGVSITDQVLLGMGSVLLQDITETGTYAGVPARKIS